MEVSVNQRLFIWTIFLCTSLSGHGSQAEPKEHWGFVDVRDKAHMFYWLYVSPALTQGRQAGPVKVVPLIMWLQGGPGGSSTGFGNFIETGPLDVDQNPRTTTWLKVASLLFVDNPVGSGFSYVDEKTALTTNVAMIAEDMLVLLKSFFMKSTWGKNYQKVPFYIFCESYGGKMTAAISEVLYNAIQAKDIECNFKGLALGDSWISPNNTMLKWGPYLYATSIVDSEGMAKINEAAQTANKFIQDEQWVDAAHQFGTTQGVVSEHSNGVNVYNIMKYGAELLGSTLSNERRQNNPGLVMERRMLRHLHDDKLTELMNGPIRKKLGIIPEHVQWGGQSGDVFQHMLGDFMKPVVDIVNRLIQKTDLHVVVYSGQLDLICCTPGTEKWIEKLDVYPEYKKATRFAILDPVTDLTSAFGKTYKKFSMYWILNAGHMVPEDNGSTALEMVRCILGHEDTEETRSVNDLESMLRYWKRKIQ